MTEWVWSNGGMILTGENWSTGRKTLYSVGGRWVNEFRALSKWYWQGKTEVLGEKTLYSMGGRWMNEFRALSKWYWQGIREKKTLRKTSQSATSSTTNSKWTNLGSNPFLREAMSGNMSIFPRKRVAYIYVILKVCRGRRKRTDTLCWSISIN